MSKRTQKNLTVMFTDISGFTKHTESISRDALMARLDTHNELLMPIVAHFDGKIVKTIGDAFLITFESPTNAVHCGLFIQHTLREYNQDKALEDQIHVKVSINSGEVTVTEHDVFGDPVNVAAKIEKATNPDEIYFTESVFLAMNKAEVPTSFVKTFRPKGADSAELKLYRVAMDEDDERYQRVVANTQIDEQKVRSRVQELSSRAEREFSRYQDALETLVSRQDKSSRRVTVILLASTLMMGAALLLAIKMWGGGGAADPAEVVAKDVRALLQRENPRAAQDRLNSYVERHGVDETSLELLDEIGKYQQRWIAEKEVELSRLAIQRGELVDALEAAKKALAAAEADTELLVASNAQLRQARALVRAEQAIQAGAAKQAQDALAAEFADTNPFDAVRDLRRQAQALLQVEQLQAERFTEPLRMLNTVVDAFGETTKNTHALKAMAEALANELYRAGKTGGYDAAKADFEAHRKRFAQLPSWRWIEAQMLMGSLWHYRAKSLRSKWRHSDAYWSKWRQVRDTVRKAPEQAYRFGCFLFLLARATHQATCDGAPFWKQALDADPTLADRHAALAARYRHPPTGDRTKLGVDLQTDLAYLLGCFTGGLDAMRALIADRYYEALQDKLIRFADSDSEDHETEQMNAVAILATKGDAARIADRVGVFQRHFATFVTSPDRLSRSHSKALFEAPMGYAEYETVRETVDRHLAEVENGEGRFKSHTRARDVLDQMQKDLRAAQPDHTAKFDSR